VVAEASGTGDQFVAQANGYRTPQRTLVTAAVLDDPRAPYRGIRHPDERWLISISAARFE
jgi:hypothetical protein